MPAIELSAAARQLLGLLTELRQATGAGIGTLAGYKHHRSGPRVGSGGRVVTLEYQQAHADARARTSPAQASTTGSRSSSVRRWTPCRSSPTRERFRHVLHRCRQGEQPRVRAVVRSSCLRQRAPSWSTTSPARVGSSTPRPTDQQARAVREMFQMMGEHRAGHRRRADRGNEGLDGFALALVR